jgi:hypothetical protein
MKNIVVLILGLIALESCSSKPVIDPETLPKDIALRPKEEIDTVSIPKKDSADVQKMEQSIRALRQEIINLSESETCKNDDDWRISPLGAKPCGGPRSYIAYPKDLEQNLLPKISKFNEASADYNRKLGLTSDCAVVPIPSGVKCENGKPVLEYN